MWDLGVMTGGGEEGRVEVMTSKWLVLAVAVAVSAGGCFTTVGGLVGHRTAAEKRAADERCEGDWKVPAQCPRPRDHTLLGMGIGAVVDVTLGYLVYAGAVGSAVSVPD